MSTTECEHVWTHAPSDWDSREDDFVATCEKCRKQEFVQSCPWCGDLDGNGFRCGCADDADDDGGWMYE